MLGLLLKALDFGIINVDSIGAPALIVSGIGIFAVLCFIYVIQSAPKPSKEAQLISQAIQEGARAFLKMEYTALSVVALCLFALVSAAVNWRTGICYLAGAVTSAVCGYIGMMVCTYSNAKTAAAAEHGLNNALRVSFSAGAVMGLTVVSVGLGALSVLLMAFRSEAIDGVGALAGFGMGCSTVSIFARVGGGIFTKAADVGADLVGKVEKDLPEDDARNPATIADNVGDNVGDVAGMGADLYSSFCGSIVASSLLGFKKLREEYKDDPENQEEWGYRGIALPFWISMSGIIAAIIGILTIRTKNGATQRDLLNVLRRGILVAAIIQIGFMAAITEVLGISWKYFGCIIIGLFCGMSIAVVSEYWTSYAWSPTKDIAKAARVGPANVVIEGLSVGMFSDVFPTLMVCGTMIAAYNLSGSNYGIALASTGLLSTLGITLATDAYGPVADNAGGIAEMTHMPPQTRENTDLLDALGNTTAAIGKGFAVGSAVLTAVSLLSSFVTRVGGPPIDTVNNDRFFAGALLGAMIPYWFAGMTMGAVNKAAQAVVVEVRRQFREIPGLMEGTARADHHKCVTMITKGALHAMAFPALLTILSPIIVGVGMGPQMLQGLIVGCIVSGFMLGGMMSAAGGAWDNAKKYIEAGSYGGKKSKAHKAAVVGDTIGDPFKDTSGPALNIVIKLVSYISVTLDSLWRNHDDFWWASLIIIGVLIVFVPVWIKLTPEGMDGSVLEPYFAAQLKEDQQEKENQQKEKEIEGKKQEQQIEGQQPGMMNGNGKVSSHPSIEEKTNGEIELSPLPELHWRILDAEDS